MNVYINPQDPALTPEQQAWLRQTLPVKREFVSPLEVAETADRQLSALLGLRAMTEACAIELMPTDVQDSLERLAPLGPRQRWIPVDDVAAQKECDAITPRSADEVRAGLRCLDPGFRALPAGQQWRAARQVFRQARQSEAEERRSSLTAAEAALDEGWTSEKAAAARARREQHQTRAWVRGELNALAATPDGHRLANVERRLDEAGLVGAFEADIKAVRLALDTRAQGIANGLSAQAGLAADKAMVYEVASAAVLAGGAIGAEVLALVEPALTRREAELAARATQAALAEGALSELAALKGSPHGGRLVEVTKRLAEAGLAEACRDQIADARRAVREAALGLAIRMRPTVRAADTLAAVDRAESAARQAGDEMGAAAAVMDYLGPDLARRRRWLEKEAARRVAAASARLNRADGHAPATHQSPRPMQLDQAAETDTLLAELRRRNPRVVIGKARLRFQALTRAAQHKFVAEVVSLQKQIVNTWARNGRVVVRERGQAGLRIVRAAEFQPDAMRLVGLEWMARRIEKRQALVIAAG